MISKIMLCLLPFSFSAFNSSENNEPKKVITVVIDAGHGGHDDGMKMDGFTEKEIVAAISDKIKETNFDQEVIIHHTRTDDEFISLEDRISYISNFKPDLVLSLHVNGNKNTTVSGMELYVSPSNKYYETSKKYASELNTQFLGDSAIQSNGVKEADFTILKSVDFPAITIELGYLTNDNDRKFLTDPAHQQKIAENILLALYKLK